MRSFRLTSGLAYRVGPEFFRPAKEKWPPKNTKDAKKKDDSWPSRIGLAALQTIAAVTFVEVDSMVFACGLVILTRFILLFEVAGAFHDARRLATGATGPPQFQMLARL